MGASDDLDQLVQPGQILAGKYRIERILGRGGMGVVVAAHHIGLDDKVAIKFLLPQAVGKPELLARFEREARAAVRIRSEHVARVSDVGLLENGSPFMVMEFLEGMDLSARIAAEGRLSVMQTAEFILQACEAIVEAHGMGIVHRDLKPANLFITRRADGLEVIKVLDFGISKSSALGGSSPSAGDMTQTQSILGSPFYMSPEQMQSARSVDMRTDIWALGCILYQCVTGEVPFEAETLPELVLKIVQTQPRPVHTFRGDVPAAFEQVIGYCLQKNRDHRYQHIGDLATGLVPFAPERGRGSAERILRTVHNTGIAAGVMPKLPPSSSNLEAASKLATFKVTPVNVPYAGKTDPSATGPNLYDSRPSYADRSSAVHSAATPSAGATVGIGPPPNTNVPGQNSSGTTPGFGVTSNSGTWGRSSNVGVPKTNGGVVALAILGGLVVLGVLATLAFVVGGKIFAAQNPSAPDAAASAHPTVTVSQYVPPPPPVVEDAGHVATTADAAPTHPVLSLTPIPPPVPAPAPLPSHPPAPAPAPAPAPVPAPSGKPTSGCNPPYYYDDQGRKVFKKECL
jgi:serine/threonine-protein kinase